MNDGTILKIRTKFYLTMDKIKIEDIRREFNATIMQIDQLPENPHHLFESWFTQAIHSKLDDPTACVLATVDEKNIPDTRVVLLKDYSEEGFTFYTNYHSRKAQHIHIHPWGALNFYWPNLACQIRVRGYIQKLSPQTSAEYFQRRPRESQIAVYASRQSEAVTREALEATFAYYQQLFQEKTHIPCPSFWGGYNIMPIEFEFWQGRHHRLHDRVQYLYHEEEGWKKQILSP